MPDCVTCNDVVFLCLRVVRGIFAFDEGGRGDVGRLGGGSASGHSPWLGSRAGRWDNAPEERNPTRAGGQRVPQVCTLYRLALGELVSFPRMSLPNIALHLGVLEGPDGSGSEIYSRRSGCE